MEIRNLLNFVQGNGKSSSSPRSLVTEPDDISFEMDVLSEGKREIDYNGDPCRKCRACGDWPGHEGGPFCFHDAVFRGKSSNPEPISKARKNCPREESR